MEIEECHLIKTITVVAPFTADNPKGTCIPHQIREAIPV